MGKVYVGQSSLRLYVNLDADLTNAGNVIISGTDPNNTTISNLVCTISDVSKGIVFYEVTSGDFTVAGTYNLWAVVNYSGGAVAYGEPFHLNIYAVGN